MSAIDAFLDQTNIAHLQTLLVRTCVDASTLLGSALSCVTQFSTKTMELYQIRYFLAVSRLLNFTRAAEECNVSQPALTRAIKKLEDELGGELFRRERSRTHLTDLGRAMVPLLQQSFDSANAAKEEAESFGRGDVAPLSIGISETVPSTLLTRILRELERAVAGLGLTILRRRADELLAGLDAGELDFVILADADGAERQHIRAWPLFDEDFVVSADRIGVVPVAVADLDGLKIVARPYCESTQRLSEALSAESVSPVHTHAVSSEADIASITRIGDVRAILPRSIANHYGFPHADIEGRPLNRSVFLIEPAGRRHNAASTWFLRLMRSADWPTQITAPASQ